MVTLEYIDMSVDINQEIAMVDFNVFVSSVGGALGLFLGFSIIDSVTYLYKYLARG